MVEKIIKKLAKQNGVQPMRAAIVKNFLPQNFIDISLIKKRLPLRQPLKYKISCSIYFLTILYLPYLLFCLSNNSTKYNPEGRLLVLMCAVLEFIIPDSNIFPEISTIL